jgi:hypothetical protein
MFRPVLMSLFLAAILPIIACAQSSYDQDQDAKIQEALQQMQELTKNVTTALQEISENSKLIGENNTQVGQLKEDLADFKDLFAEELVKQQQILDEISRADSSGRRIPRISAAMDSPEFREEMTDSVHGSMQRQGKLHIANTTTHTRRIQVNRVAFDVAPGERRTFDVPAGSVATQLDGEGLKTWTIAPPNYEQSIEIIPRTTPTIVARPVIATPSPLPVISSVPTFVDPFFFFPTDVVYLW